MCALFITLWLSVSVAAQKPKQDPRPLQGQPAERIPEYRPGALSQPAPPAFSSSSPLFDLGTPVGRAERAPLNPRLLGSFRAVFSGTAARRHIELPPRPQAGLELYLSENGTPYWIGFPTPRPVARIQHAEQAFEQARQVLFELRHLLRIENPLEEFALHSVQEDVGQRWHVRLQQLYRGLPLWGRDLYVHLGPEGVYAINGRYEPTPRIAVLQPTLTREQALARTTEDLRRRGEWAPLDETTMRWLDLEPPRVELLLYPDGGRYYLAYSVRLHASLLGHYEYLLDAQTGAILNRISRTCAFTGTPVPTVRARWQKAADTPRRLAGQFTSAQAIDLNGRTQNLRTYQHDNGTYYMVWDLPNLNLQRSQLPDNPAGGALTIDARNQDFRQGVQLYHVTSTNNTWSDASAVSAHVNMKICYDYYKNTFNRRAIDDKDQSLISIIHVTENGQSMENAFWNGRFMVYGDGGRYFKPFAGSLDVAGHEMTHGVIQHTADLVYQFQPGALNESFADVFSIMIDRDDFLMGEDIVRPGAGPATRDLANPSNPALLQPQPSHMSQYQDWPIERDNGGVHINSGIPNRAAYLVIQAIGREKTERIYYQALSKYLTRTSQFVDCRLALERAAQDLYGSGAELNAVRQAFDAVGIVASGSGGGGGGGGGPTIPPVSGTRQVIVFMFDDGQIAYYDLTNNQGAVFTHPEARARVSEQGADRAQLSTAIDPRTGRLFIFYITPRQKLASIELATGQVQVFDNLYLQQPGDLWNASIAPDGSFVALVSAYNKDPHVYLSDGRQILRIPIRPETTAPGGLQDASIQYPDVVAWSPDKKKLGLDAYHELTFGVSRVAYWAMYEIDLASGKVYALIPGQSTDVTIGNITYGNTNPNLIAFNYVDELGIWDIVVADLGQRTGGFLNIPDRNFGGLYIDDAMRPTFSPDDQALAFVSPSNQLLVFYDRRVDQFTIAQSPVPIYNPKWAVDGARLGTGLETEAELPGRTILELYPNPAQETVRIRFRAEVPEGVRLALYDLLGRRIRVLYEGRLPEGVFSWDGRDAQGRPLAAGVYMVRLERSDTGSGILHRRVVWLGR
jgi:Zn-dependent metalloprotease